MVSQNFLQVSGGEIWIPIHASEWYDPMACVYPMNPMSPIFRNHKWKSPNMKTTSKMDPQKPVISIGAVLTHVK